MNDRTQSWLHEEPCPPLVDRVLALLDVGLVVLDMDLTAAAVEADVLLREENPHWALVETIPDAYQPPEGGWLDARTAEAALREAVDLLDTHASKAVTPTERLTGSASVARLMRTLRHRPHSATWADARDVQVSASAT